MTLRDYCCDAARPMADTAGEDTKVVLQKLAYKERKIVLR